MQDSDIAASELYSAMGYQLGLVAVNGNIGKIKCVAKSNDFLHHVLMISFSAEDVNRFYVIGSPSISRLNLCIRVSTDPY